LVLNRVAKWREMPAPTADTFIDAVNERDEAIGMVRRGEALDRGRNFRTAHIFILNAAGDLLLQRLAKGRERHPGRWGSSLAAYLFAGESYRDGASRRMREELGLAVALHPLGKLEVRDVDSLKFVTLFLAHAEGAEIREPQHIAELRYWSLQEIDAALDRDAQGFTPTFAQLFRAFRAHLH